MTTPLDDKWVEASAFEEPLPPDGEVARETLVSADASMDFDTVGDWWDAGGPERPGALTESERVALYRERIEAEGQQRLPGLETPE